MLYFFQKIFWDFKFFESSFVLVRARVCVCLLLVCSFVCLFACLFVCKFFCLVLFYLFFFLFLFVSFCLFVFLFDRSIVRSLLAAQATGAVCLFQHAHV